MYTTTILAPVLTMVLLTALVWVRMYYCRLTYIFRHHVNPDQYKNRSNHDENVPATAIAASENLMNLFEMPVLFYVATITLQIAQLSDQVFIILCWLYVALRYLHSFIHVTYNRVVHRFTSYIASTLVLWIIWSRIVVVMW